MQNVSAPTVPAVVETAEIALPITGMTCASCVNRIDRFLRKADGVSEVSVNLATESATIRYLPELTGAADLARVISNAGYEVPAAALDLAGRANEGEREAAREALLTEMTGVFENDGTYINYHHLSLLCDRMTASSHMVSIFRHGINNDNIGPIAKASFEETPEMFLKAARHAELDQMRGISANVMCGQEGYYGTSSFQVMLDLPQMIAKMEDVAFQAQNEQAEIAEAMGSAAMDTSACAFEKLTIESNVGSIQKVDLGHGADNYNVGF